MKRSEVRALIKSAVELVKSSYQFNSGRLTEFNKQRSNEYPFVWLESLSASGDFRQADQMPIDDWDISLHIAKKDAMDSTAEQYEAIVDECDLIAQKIAYQLNNVVSGYKTITLSGFAREPFIKRHADVMTGVNLTFNLNTPDLTDVC